MPLRPGLTLALALLLGWPAAAQSPAGGADPTFPDTLDLRRLRHTLIGQGAYAVAGTSVLYLNWYRDRARVPFHVYDDAAGYLQVDKCGHAYAAYAYSYWGYRTLRQAGVRKGPALVWGGGLGLYLQTPIEVFDGLYEGWGFSWSDMGANALGTGLFVAQEALLDRQVARLKFGFQRTAYARAGNGYLGDGLFAELLNDYNGHTYWLSAGLGGLAPKLAVPPWLNLAVGYGAGGMYGEFENRRFYRGQRLPTVERHRQFYLSLDVDWTAVPTRSRLLRALFQGLNFVKVPFPALEYDTRGRWRGRWVGF